MNNQQLLSLIDYTLLQPDATEDQVIALCVEARQYGFASVCVNGSYVSLAARELAGSDVRVGGVVGFPLGAMETSVKIYETERAIEQGAQEIDMVMNIGAMKSRDLRKLHHDIAAVVLATHAHEDVICKVTIETGLLTEEEKTLACQIAKEARADFIKTCTNFETTIADIRLIRSIVSDDIGIKTFADDVKSMVAMVEAGATRIEVYPGTQMIPTQYND